MGESPRFEFPADPTKARYGPVAHGLKGLIDGLSRGTGLSSAQVVAALLTAATLSMAVVAAAVIIIARDTGPAKPEAVSDYVPGGPPPPDPAALNAVAYGASPAPTNFLGDPGDASTPEASPRSIPLSSFVNWERKDDPPQASSDEAPQAEAPKKDWFKPKAWLLKERSMPQVKEAFSGTQKSQQSSSAQSSSQVPGGGGGIAPESMTKRRFATSAEERAGRYAGEVPSVPGISNGVAVGAEQPPAERDPEAGPASPVKNKKGKVEGPVKQEKVPDVGPGVQVNNVQSGPGPSGQPRIGAASGGDILSVPIDVNRIQVEANRANDVDRSPGINTIGK